MSEDFSGDHHKKSETKSDLFLKYFLLIVGAVALYLLPEFLEHLSWLL